MRKSIKIISIILVISLLATGVFFGFRGNLGSKIKDFFGNIGKSDKNPVIETSDEAVLPDRPFILSEEDKSDIDISVYLAEQTPSVETILLNDNLYQQLRDSDSLDDVADSMSQVDNLRSVRDQLDLLEERLEDDKDADPELQDRIGSLAKSIDAMFAAGKIPKIDFSPATPLMGIWEKPDKAILRWNPYVDWVPEDGYNLYRSVAGSTALVASDLGSLSGIEKTLTMKAEFSEYLKPLFDESRPDSEMLTSAGVENTEAFNVYLAEILTPVASSYLFTGEKEFERSRKNIFTVEGTLVERVPAMDFLTGEKVKSFSEGKALPFSISYLKKFGTQSVALSVMPALAETSDLPEKLASLAQSRNDLLTKSNLDIDFAGAAGFAYEDDLSKLSLSDGTLIKYTLVPQKPELKGIGIAEIASGNLPEGVYSANVERGKTTPFENPTGLIGYGVDSTVYLRWDSPSSENAKRTVSGYMVERKLNKESSFKQVNEAPVVISYMNDEDGILYEMPDFYIDTDIANEDEAVYRIRALDIFGRMSDYSDSLEITVYKITPPGTPELSQPVISDEKPRDAEAEIEEAAELNSGKTGVILPIRKTTDDTHEIAVYRSKAPGSGAFDDPVRIAKVEIPLPKNESDETSKTLTVNGIKILLNPLAPSKPTLTFFDIGIEEGYFYKYWVSAIDSVGNESAWSESKLVGYKSETPPPAPSSATAEMKTNLSPKAITEVPGFADSKIVSTVKGKLSEDKDEDTGKNSFDASVFSDFARLAFDKDVTIGESLSLTARSKTLLPREISLNFFNLPDYEDIHRIILLEDEDIFPDGSARVSWSHFSGENLGGYHIYRAFSDTRSLEEIQAMGAKELTQAFVWTRVAENLHSNLLTEKIEKKAGRIYMYLVFPVPDKGTAGLNTSDLDKDSFSSFLSAG